MSLPQVVMKGNLVADPELRFTAGGKSVVSMRVACSERRKQGEEWVDGDECFLAVTAWNSLADNIAESLTKGHRVVVAGRLKQRSYETNSGEKRTVYEVIADSVAPALDAATVKVQRVTRNQTDARKTVEDAWAPGPLGGGDEPPF
jgi:single-strand DNA-binding protein